MFENFNSQQRKEQDMTNQENSFPQSAQEANEEALQQYPSFVQEELPALDEEQLEEVTGAGILPGCCRAPRTSSPPRTALQAPASSPPRTAPQAPAPQAPASATSRLLNARPEDAMAFLR